jgi:amino acid permease
MGAPRRVKAGMIVLALFVALTVEFVIGSDIRSLEPTRSGIFKLEVCILGLILAGFVAEEVVGLLSGKERLLRDRLLILGYFFSAFVCSMVIFDFVTKMMGMPVGPTIGAP